MINIDNINYKGTLKESTVIINDEPADILVLDIDIDLEDIKIVKHNDLVYKISKIINRFEGNKKWLLVEYVSEDIEKKERDKLKEEVQESKELIERLRTTNKANLQAIMEVNSRLREIESEKA